RRLRRWLRTACVYGRCRLPVSGSTSAHRATSNARARRSPLKRRRPDMQLPWELEFEPEPIDGASVALAFEPGASRLVITMKNVGDTVIRPRELRLVAEVDAPAAGGWVWIQGRY